MGKPDKDDRLWTYCFYCGREKLSAKKRKTFARTICDECVAIRRGTRGERG